MSSTWRVVAILPVLDEAERIRHLVSQIPRPVVDEVLVVDDCSSDDTDKQAELAGAKVIRNKSRLGCGGSIRIGIQEALRQEADVIVIMAGNGKDDPRYIPDLIEAIKTQSYDLVQGSRYLKGGLRQNMPFHRKLGTRAYSFLFSLLSGYWMTDATNGFRAFRTSLLEDKRINLWQEWLVNYEVESYLLAQAIRLGYRVGEIPVSKIYPTSATESYTKMKPFSDWWSHFRPALLLALGLKQ
ncbi:MAG: glycosyltransferase family 2 protein [Candidatus Omnitrophica bacterium]|nr:glycosyltransferase family 2 protein [Candidatus Omnitrophota bacterium]MBI2174222.1 glycosyltransferase family 2 protein [Candidatus Omnitrophota bacterium]MBI3010510.1 glycosyltransferase family 2 protein [Candidatus Omnitrophota bacterium]